MWREVRRVPADWQHPKDECGNFDPLFDGVEFEQRAKVWDEEAAKWASGWRPDCCSEDKHGMSYEEWEGERPKAENYMPVWSESERTHYMAYETVTEGTPISPAFATPEELALWLADAGGNYEEWLCVARGGFTPDLVYTPETGLVSSVDALEKNNEKRVVGN
jgi:hypothetical protein